MLLCNSSKLIDFHTSTAKIVSKILNSWKQTIHIHIIFNRQTKMLKIYLSRLQFDFFMKKKVTLFKSKQFREIIVNSNQSIDILIELINKFVFRNNIDSSRNVIISYDNVRFESNDHHVRVHIDISIQHFSYYFYHIDFQFERFVDNDNLKNKLFKNHFHAITIHCLIDELIDRIDIEETFHILTFSSIQSFFKFDQTKINFLIFVVRLTSRRYYYSRHFKIMQKINEKTFFDFTTFFIFSFCAVNFRTSAHVWFFFDKFTKLSNAKICEKFYLFERIDVRNVANRVHEFEIKHRITKHNVKHIAWNNVTNNFRKIRICHIAKLIDNWSTKLKNCSQLFREMKL